jgi:hypothetical protein
MEIQSGFCGAHIGTEGLAGKAIKQGFYWPTINIDAKKLVRECEACQKNNESAKLTIHASSPNSTITALAKVGNGSSWTTTNSSRKLQIRSCGRRLLHQMGGSESIGEYHNTNNS